MAGIFSISPINSLSFVRVNTLLSNYDNTLHQDMDNIGLKKIPYCQRITNGDVITIQVKTDFTSVTAYLYNIITGAVTTLTPVEETTYTSFSFWEIPVTFSTNGYYKMFITGILSGYVSPVFVSEMIQVDTSWDGVKIDCYNSDNTAYIDYTNGLVHMLRVSGAVTFTDIGGKDELYNNRGTEEIVYSETETLYEITIENIPYYLCRQIIYMSKLDIFKINDCQYVVKEHSTAQGNGSYSYDLTLKLTKKIVYGVNEDFETEAV